MPKVPGFKEVRIIKLAWRIRNANAVTYNYWNLPLICPRHCNRELNLQQLSATSFGLCTIFRAMYNLSGYVQSFGLCTTAIEALALVALHENMWQGTACVVRIVFLSLSPAVKSG